MVRRDLVLAEPLGKLMRNAFGQASSVDKNKRRAVSLDEVCKPAINFCPHFEGHHSFERARQLMVR
jgi:hypothetical protein